MSYNPAFVENVVKSFGTEPSRVIQILQDIQSEYRYIPREAVAQLSKILDIPEPHIYHIATFYKAFSLEPRGRHEIKVCLGTACHIKGGKRIAEGFERSLNIKAGKTTSNKMFTLETVNCLGACALAPLVQVDEDNYGKMTMEKIDRVIKKYSDKKK